MRFVSFFAGIGGIDLGLERAGHECVGQIEIDPYCNRVLAKHWPNVWRHDDVLTVKPESIPAADLWCGGFPCQDISNAGKRAGIHGERSGLFFDWMRLVRAVRPRYLLMENVAALLHRGMGEVLGELAASGYDAEWECLPASAVGLYHNHERVFICAYCQGAIPRVFADSRGERRGQLQSRRLAGSQAVEGWPIQRFQGEPDVAPLVHGLPRSVDRTGKQLGNAVVPQVAEYIGRCLKRVETTLLETNQ